MQAMQVAAEGTLPEQVTEGMQPGLILPEASEDLQQKALL